MGVEVIQNESNPGRLRVGGGYCLTKHGKLFFGASSMDLSEPVAGQGFDGGEQGA